ncbi:MAG: hypothetical protein JWO09_2837 [Bacteroidetes bacterium]|nr:hypothetical protein [Bacteroidota bacterium]
MQKPLTILLSLFLLASCSPTRFVKPLAKKEHAANLSFGGPLIKFGTATIPIPFVTVNYGYGIDSTLTGFASFNITSALYGNFQAELGATKQWTKQHAYLPALGTTLQLNAIYRNTEAKKLYPQLDLHAYWEYGKRKNYFYIGASNWFELSKTRTLGVSQDKHWILMPMAGHSFNGKKWNVNIEAKIMAPNLSNEKLVVDYQTPLRNRGAFGVYIGYTRKF